MATAVRRRRLALGLVAAGVVAALVLLGAFWWGGAAGGDDTDEAGAAPAGAPAETPATATNARGSWDVVGFDGSSTTQAAEQDAQLTLGEDAASGDDGCNAFDARVVWGRPGEMRLDSFRSTYVGCFPHTSVLGSLQLVTGAVLLDPDTLHLRDAEGATVVELRRTGTTTETSADVDGTWVVERVVGEELPHAGDARITIAADALRGVDVCNSVGGEVVRGDDGALRFGRVITTLVGCGTRFGQTLVDTRSAEVRDGDELVLRAGDGMTLVELRRVRFPEGRFATALGDGTRVELLVADGGVSSPAGCDGLVGTYEAADDGTFAFEPGIAAD